MFLLWRTAEKQKTYYWTNANKAKKQKIAFWKGSLGASVAGTWGTEDFMSVETNNWGCQWCTCLMTLYDINPLKTAVNNGLFSADRMFCARESRLPEASG